jgi:hypothetical protein
MPPKKINLDAIVSTAKSTSNIVQCTDNISNKKILNKKKIIQKEESSESESESESESSVITDSEDEKSEENNDNKKINDKGNDTNTNIKRVLIENYNEKLVETHIKKNNNENLKKLFTKYIYENNSQLDRELNYAQNEKKWVKKYFDMSNQKEYYYEYEECPKIIYESSEELVKQIKRCAEIKNLIIDFKPIFPDIKDNKLIYKVIKVSDDKENSFIAYTKQTIETALKTNILYRIIYKDDNKKETQWTVLNINKIKCELLGCFKGNLNGTGIEKIKNMLDINKLNTLKTIGYKRYQKEISDMIPKDINKYMKKKPYYIYKIQDNKTQYIFGSFKSMIKKNITEICDKYNLTFDNTRTIEELEKIECYFECEGLCKVDEYICKNNSINNGLNICTNLILPISKKNETDIIIKEHIFMNIQKELMMNNYKDILQPKLGYGYIVKISNTDKSYIFYESNKTIKEKLRYYYSLRKEYSEDEILNIISVTPFEELKITIIEKNISIDILEDQYNFYVRQLQLYKIEKKETKKTYDKQAYYKFKHIYKK